MPEVGTAPGLCVSRVLAAAQQAAGAVGTATLLTLSVIPGQSLHVMVSSLPHPVTFGANLTSYALVLIDTDTGLEVVRQPMAVVPSEAGAWAGSVTTSGNNLFPEGCVLIYASQDGLLGPQVAAANLAHCRQTPY